MENNKEKVGLTGLEWVLSIAGILVLLCVIVLPPVFRSVFKEEEKEEIPAGVVIENVTCTKNNFILDGFMTNETISFKYLNDHVRSYTIKKEVAYDSLESYDNAKQAYGRLNTAYSLLEGLTYEVNANESNLKIAITEAYDLGSFKSTTINIPGDDQQIKVNSIYTTDDSMKSIKYDLESEGYSCK